MHETGCSGPVHWDDPEGWDGEGAGRGGSGWGNTCTPMVNLKVQLVSERNQSQLYNACVYLYEFQE